MYYPIMLVRKKPGDSTQIFLHAVVMMPILGFGAKDRISISQAESLPTIPCGNSAVFSTDCHGVPFDM